jgi:hypothetical protein
VPKQAEKNGCKVASNFTEKFKPQKYLHSSHPNWLFERNLSDIWNTAVRYMNWTRKACHYPQLFTHI